MLRAMSNDIGEDCAGRGHVACAAPVEKHAPGKIGLHFYGVQHAVNLR